MQGFQRNEVLHMHLRFVYESRGLKQTMSLYTTGDLRQRQSLPLDAKIMIAQKRVKEWHDAWTRYQIRNTKTGRIRYSTKQKPEDVKLFQNEVIEGGETGQMYIAFSGGKDSTVLMHLVRQLYTDTPAVFIDTGLEYPEVRKFALSQENVTAIKPEMNFRKVIEAYGYPIISKEVSNKLHLARNGYKTGVMAMHGLDKDGNVSEFRKRNLKWAFLLDAPFRVSARCCEVMKKYPAKHYEHETGLKPILGMMAEESQLRQNSWMQNGCNIYDNRRPVSKPLSVWTENDVLEYIDRFDVPYASVYGDLVKDDNGIYSTTGCHRTGCVFCGYGVQCEKEPNRFQKLKESHPQLYEYCFRDWNRGGLGMAEVLDYINVKY